jgi:hypothetical protein
VLVWWFWVQHEQVIVLDEVWDKKLHFWTLFALNTVLTSLGLTLGIGTGSRLGNITRLVEGVPTTDEEG